MNTGAGGVIEIDDAQGVRTVWLNRPDKLNALNTDLTAGLCQALSDADSDPDVRAVVLTGRGRGFCAGADLAEFKHLTPADQDAVTTRAALTAQLQGLPQRLAVPVIAAIAGPTRGGGAGLALACDMVVAAESATVGYPEVRHSIVPALVMTGLQRNFGRKLAFELISTGRSLTAAELVAAGVVNEIAPTAADAVARAQEIAQIWAGVNHRAMAASKELFYRVADLPFDAGVRAGQDVNTIMRSFRTEDAR